MKPVTNILQQAFLITEIYEQSCSSLKNSSFHEKLIIEVTSHRPLALYTKNHGCYEKSSFMENNNRGNKISAAGALPTR